MNARLANSQSPTECNGRHEDIGRGRERCTFEYT